MAEIVGNTHDQLIEAYPWATQLAAEELEIVVVELQNTENPLVAVVEEPRHERS